MWISSSNLSEFSIFDRRVLNRDAFSVITADVDHIMWWHFLKEDGIFARLKCRFDKVAECFTVGYPSMLQASEVD